MDSRFCVGAFREALARYGCPKIFNTDQGSQFTSFGFTGALKDADIAILMDGRGRCLDNISSSGCGGRSSTRPSTCTR